MFSVVKQKGFQYKVAQGDVIDVQLMDAEKDSEVVLDQVLMVGEADSVKIGTPIVEGAVVKAKVLGNIKGDKVLIIKKKRRKDYKRKIGHRQNYTQLQITSISA